MDKIVFVACDSRWADHDKMLHKVLQNTESKTYVCMSLPFFCEIILRQEMKPYLRKLKALTSMPSSK